MKDFLMQLAHASFQGSVIIAVIFALRFALKKAPKSILCLLWLLAITRLLLPIQLESSLSLQPDIAVITQQESQQPESLVQTPSQQVPAVPMETIQIGDGEIIHPIYSDSIITPEQPATFDWASVLPWIWLSVAAGLALWSILSYLRLRSRTKNAIVLTDGVWLSPELDSAFVLGYLKPQIYLPAKLEAEEWQLVISHEQAHIRRFDHWYKLLGFITLCVHWFNPLVWLAYIFLCRDMEMACDEQVVRDMDTQQRKAYSMALLRCSADSHHFKPCPVAFAEVSVKDRIKGVLNYKKPGFWMTLVGIIAVVFVAVCFLTSPKPSEQDLQLECIRIQQYLHNTITDPYGKPIHLRFSLHAGTDRECQRELLSHSSIHYMRSDFPKDDLTTEWFFIESSVEDYQFYSRLYNTSMFEQNYTAWAAEPDLYALSSFIQSITPEDLQHASMTVKSSFDGFNCIFNITQAVRDPYTLTYHFNSSGELISITQVNFVSDGTRWTNTAVIVSTSADEIIAKLDAIYAEVLDDTRK